MNPGLEPVDPLHTFDEVFTSRRRTTRPAIDDPRLDFIDNALRFCAEHRGDWAFRYLRRVMRASEEDFTHVMGGIFCDSLPQCPGGTINEAIPRSLLKLLLLPLFYVLKKTYFWRAEVPVLFDLEVIDQPYFDRWFRKIYETLPGPKHVTSAGPATFEGVASTSPISSTVTLRSLLWLILAPLWALPLWRLSRRYDQNILFAYRKAMSMYALFEGHFRRYPCRHFVSYCDDTNPPGRYLAFRQNCAGELVVVQNGIRLHHPWAAFGITDTYLSFGPFMSRLAPELKMRVGRIIPIGALYLDGQYPLIERLSRAPEPPLYDILLIDQCLWPYNDLDQRTASTFEKVFKNLNEYKTRHPAARIACQLRNYTSSPDRKDYVLNVMRRHFVEPIEILENSGRGESYTAVSRSRMAMTLHSTLGLEAFYFGKGKKTLFANCGGDPFSIASLDPRFQLYDESADYDRFDRAVTSLLELGVDEVPEEFREQLMPPDGKVAQRIAEFLATLN
jgi:hypothetical protein